MNFDFIMNVDKEFLMSWTYSRIRWFENAGWQVPDILRNRDIRYFDDPLTALNFADYKCSLYNTANKARGLKKIPILDSQAHSTTSPSGVHLGDKARVRLSVESSFRRGESGSSDRMMKVVNVVVLSKDIRTLSGMITAQYRAFGQVMNDGEVASVVSRDNINSTSFQDIRWTNVGLNEVRRQFDFPPNIFFPKDERDYDFPLTSSLKTEESPHTMTGLFSHTDYSPNSLQPTLYERYVSQDMAASMVSSWGRFEFLESATDEQPSTTSDRLAASIHPTPIQHEVVLNENGGIQVTTEVFPDPEDDPAGWGAPIRWMR